MPIADVLEDLISGSSWLLGSHLLAQQLKHEIVDIIHL